MKTEMKDSGIAWIGEIPKHWEVIRFKNFLELINTPSISQKKIGLENIEGETGHFIPSESKFEGDGVQFSVNNIVYGKLRPYLQKVWLAEFEGNAVGDFFVFSVQKNGVPQYVKWLMLSDGFTKIVDSSTYGAKMPRVASDFILNLPFYLPPITEQTAIAQHLDKKCTEIDELISLQEQMITQLTTYKQAVITETATKGLNPNVKMKPSGMEWIGEIPEHWRICKIQYMANLKSGYNLTTEEISDEGLYPVYGGNGIRGYYHDFFNEGEYVLIGRQGALCGNINYSAGKFWATEHAVVCYPKMEYATKWFGELLRSMNLNQYSLASAQPGLAVERIKALSIPLPPSTEQQSIAHYLDQKCQDIDALISLKQEKIEQLKAYKKSVIFEYVTGKKRV